MRKLNILSVLFFIIFTIKVKARDIEVINNKTIFKVFSLDKATIIYEEEAIIYNQTGLSKLNTFWIYDGQTTVHSFKCSIESNNKISNYNLSNLQDQSLAEINYQLYSDIRVKFLPIGNITFPARIKYTVEEKLKGFTRLPSFRPITNFNLKVNEASYEVIMPINFELNIILNNYDGTIDTTYLESFKSLKFTLKDLKEFEPNCFQQSLEDLSPSVDFTPKQASYYGYKVPLNNWQEIAEWVDGLLLEANSNLSEQTLKEIDLLKSKFEGKELAEKVYILMQSRVRYVGIQLGIGGYKPNSIADTDKYGYGDCKALSLYYVKMLENAGIKAHYTLINTYGSTGQQKPKFNGLGSFNHAIVCIPINGDTLFAECTSQTSKFNENNNFTGGKWGFIISNGNGIWHKLPEGNQSFFGKSYTLTNDINNKLLLNNKSPLESEKFKNSIYYYNNQILLTNFSIKLEEICNKSERKTPIFIDETTIYSDTLIIESKDSIIIEKQPINITHKNKIASFESKLLRNDRQILWIKSIKLNAGLYPNLDNIHLNQIESWLKASDVEEVLIQIKKNN